MILCIGELLADVIGSEEDATVFKIYCGGAPFNVAFNAVRAGGRAGFVGRVGDDPVGRFLKETAASSGLDYCDVQTDPVRNTTLALVTLVRGERDFSFFRHDTADAFIDLDKVNFSDKNINIVHFGSLMLGTEAGKVVAEKIISEAKKANKILSFDVNYRQDIFGSEREAKETYLTFIKKTDILKLSEDELYLLAGTDDLIKAADGLRKKDQLVLVTLGGNGSYYAYNGLSGFVETEKVIPIDSTGAGDAFFGTALKELDGTALESLTEEKLRSAIKKANLAGAIATQHKGAL